MADPWYCWAALRVLRIRAGARLKPYWRCNLELRRRLQATVRDLKTDPAEDLVKALEEMERALAASAALHVEIEPSESADIAEEREKRFMAWCKRAGIDLAAAND